MSSPHTTSSEHEVDVASQRRHYTLVAGDRRADVNAAVLLFHGSNQTASGLRRATGGAFDGLAVDGTVVVYLHGHRKSWHDARRNARLAAHRAGVDDVAFTAAVVEALVAEQLVDPARVFALGFSNGGQMVIRLVHEAPGLLAGAAVVAATQPVPEDFALPLPPAPAVPLPVLLVHGTRDPIVPFDGGPTSLWGFRPRGRGLSAPETAAYFARRNGVTTPPVHTDLPHRDLRDPTTVQRTDHQQNGQPPVTLYTVRGGGHTIPGAHAFPRIMGRTGRDLDTARAVAEFFALPHP